MFSPFLSSWSLDEKGHLLRVKDFRPLIGTMRTLANSLDERGDFLADDMLTDFLMIDGKARKILFIKKMAEGPVTNIMEESSQAKEFLDVGERREFCFENLKERGIKLFREGPCDMQGAEGVLETSMFGCGKYPSCAL
jgi:hypothetical protein